MNADYLEFMRKRPEDFRGTAPGTPIQILTDEAVLLELERTLHCQLGILYQDSNILLLRDGVITPTGAPGTYLRILPAVPESPVVILPVVGARVLLLSHYRHSIRDRVWELPRGFGCYGLTPEENARKELSEETGLLPFQLEYLGTVCPDTGLLSTRASVYLARIADPAAAENHDEEEAIETERLVTLPELKQMVQLGQVLDGFTLSALSLALFQGKLVL